MIQIKHAAHNYTKKKIDWINKVNTTNVVDTRKTIFQF